MDAHRIERIRDLLDDEDRTGVELTDVAAELLTEVESLRSAARSAAVLLRSAADRTDSGQRIDAATLRHAATALDDLTS